MAINAEQLNIILSARDKEFTKAMDRSQKRVAHFASKSQKNLSKTGKSFNALGDAAKRLGPALLAAFSVAALKGALDGAVAIGQLAKIAGVTNSEFQVLALTTQQFGIEQDKLSDILKDVNDKFGDFTQTGAGPLADFFEFIAPKIGLTADAFADLSSDKKLGAYINALEEANLSQSEMTFYMEAIASDSTALIGAFQNNGAAIDVMRGKAESLGLVLEDDVIEKSKAAKQELALMSAVVSTNLTEALVSIAPLLTGASTGIAALARQASNFMNVFREIGSDGLDGPEFSSKRLISDVQDDIAALKVARADIGKAKSEILGDKAYEDLSVFGKVQFGLQDRNLQSVVGNIEALTIQLGNLRKEAEVAAGPVANAVNPADAARSGLSNIISQTEQLERQAEVNRMSAESVERQRISREKDAIVAKALKSLIGEPFSAENTTLRLDAIAAGDAYEVAATKASLILNPLEKAKQATKKIREAAITASEAVTIMNQNMIDGSPLLQNLGFDAEGLGHVMSSVENSMESAFMSMIDGTSSASDAFKSMASSIIKELYRVLVVKKITGFITGAIGGLVGGGSSAGSGGKASGGPVKAGQSYMTGEHGRELFVPQVNGRVLSAAQTSNASGGGGDGVTVIQSNTFGNGVSRAEVNAMLPKMVEATKSAVADAKLRGGSYGRSFA
jgi:hypothetical protein